MLTRIVFRNNEMKITHLVAAISCIYVFVLRPSTCWELGIQTYDLISRSPQAT